MPRPNRQRRRPVASSFRLHAERLESRTVLSLAPLPPAIDWLAGGQPMFVDAAAAPASSGPISHTVTSPYQRTQTRIRVLLPSNYDPALTYRTVYVLPVEAGNGTQFGDGLQVVQRANLHNIHQTIFVAPSFSDMPWYADHVSNTKVRQESHLVRVVVPFIEQRYSASRLGADRLLLGFSKSGYGAFSLLLRNPDTFGRAFAWDSPVGMSDPATGWDYLKILGSRSNFQNYRITNLLTRQAPLLSRQPPRLLLGGYSYGFTRSDHAKVSGLMTSLGIPHVYEPGRYRAHTWTSGWVPGAVAQLMSTG